MEDECAWFILLLLLSITVGIVSYNCGHTNGLLDAHGLSRTLMVNEKDGRSYTLVNDQLFWLEPAAK